MFCNKYVIEVYVRFTTYVQSDISLCAFALESLPPLIDGLINDGLPEVMTIPQRSARRCFNSSSSPTRFSYTRPGRQLIGLLKSRAC